jgi:Helix-turn-helix domain
VSGFDSLPSHTFVINDLGGSVAKNVANQLVCNATKFINPHRLFHGVWLPQLLEERSEVSEKAKKLYAYLTYFAGGKGYSWPSFGLLGEKLHCSRRHVIRLVQELSTHRLITVTNVNNSERGHCANY